jgi:hypothetical protein
MKKIYEDLLAFVWQYGKIPIHLQTTDGKGVEIIHPGVENTDSGPDFFNAKVKIEDTVWVGNVEFHVKTSDWTKHKHDKNAAYDTVILHVVYEHDVEKAQIGIVNDIPVVELKQYMNQELIDRYYSLVSSPTWIPCENNLQSVEQITVKPWLSRITVERLEQKTLSIRQMLAHTSMDWETTFFHWFSSCFGFKLNNHAFLLLAKSIPYKIIMKHSDNLKQIEALLFGQAGLLMSSYQDEYAVYLKSEYEFLAQKYKLKPIDPKVWKFMRTRPGNFPTIRISQLAFILSNMSGLLAEMFGDVKLSNVKKLLKSQTSDYWKDHYHFDKMSKTPKSKQLGLPAIESLIINAIVPFVFLYGDFHDNDAFKQAAVDMLEELPGEKNHIIKKWVQLQISPENAAESQALIELFNSYCQRKKCLNCSIGASLLLDVGS